MSTSKLSLAYVLENPRGRALESHIRKTFPAEYELVKESVGSTWSEKLYNYLHGNPDVPTCPICGKLVGFVSLPVGYHTYCSRECHRTVSVQEMNRKVQETYGVDNISQAPGITEKKRETMAQSFGSLDEARKHRVRLSKKTKLERYGDENYNNREALEGTLTKNWGSPAEAYRIATTKAKATKLRRYGDENYTNTEAIKETYTKNWGSVDKAYEHITRAGQATKLRRYGDPTFNNFEKTKATKLRRYGDEHYNNPQYGSLNGRAKLAAQDHPEIVRIEPGGLWLVRCPDPTCSLCTDKIYKTDASTYHNRLRYGTEQCTIKNPIASPVSKAEDELASLLDSYGVDYIRGDRLILKGLELDLYVPSKRLAIEYNGVYWHSDKCKPRSYHIDKYKACRETGIQLIQIWEDWWTNKRSVVESFLAHKLGVTSKKVGARKCEIRKVSPSAAKVFLDRNHIQGAVRASIRLGLYYEGVLISLMTFGKSRLAMGSTTGYELIRFCNKSGWSVPGGASRLLGAFRKDHPGVPIISFSSCDISDGGLYKTLGFKTSTDKISPGYWYIEPGTLKRYHRFTFNKRRLEELGWAPDATDWTETEVMDRAGYYRIYDSGTLKWELE